MLRITIEKGKQNSKRKRKIIEQRELSCFPVQIALGNSALLKTLLKKSKRKSGKCGRSGFLYDILECIILL